MLIIPPTSAFSRNVELNEVKVDLYSKSVSGYRFALDRNYKFIHKKISSHVQKWCSEPQLFDKTIICEKIIYDPVTAKQPISLYYILKDVNGSFTEVTAIAMYDYQRSLNSRDFPDLSMRFVLDLSQLVRRISGDIIVFNNIVFTNEVLHDFQSRYPDQQATEKQVVEVRPQEETDDPGVMIKGDPFAKSELPKDEDSVITYLKQKVERFEARIKELEKWERSLDERERLLEQQAKNQNWNNADVRQLQDSIRRLNNKLQGMLYLAYAGDDLRPSSHSISDSLERLEAKMNFYRDKYHLALVENDSLFQQIQVVQDIQKNRIRNLEMELFELNKENEVLTAEVKTAKEKLNEAWFSGDKQQKHLQFFDSLSNVIASLEKQNQFLESRIDGLQEDNQVLRKENEEISQKQNDLLAENRKLNDELSSKPQPAVEPQPVPEGGTWTGAGRDSLLHMMAVISDLNDTLASRNQSMIFMLKDLNEKFKKLEAEYVKVNKENKQLAANQQNSKVLRDSIQVLNQKVRVLSQNSTAGDQQQQLAAKEAQVTKLQQQVNNLSASNKKLNADLTEAQNESKVLEAQLKTAITHLKELSASSDGMLEKMRHYQQVADSLNRECIAMKKQYAAADKMVEKAQDSITYWRGQSYKLAGQRDEYYGRAKLYYNRYDSLQNEIAIARKVRDYLALQVDSLKQINDSLSVAAMPVTEEEKFVKEQRMKLEKKERELNAWEEDLANKQKLTTQKEAFLDERERNLNKLADKYADISLREESLKIVEQKLKQQKGAEEIMEDVKEYINKHTSGAGGAGINSGGGISNAQISDITSSRVSVPGGYIPVFLVTVTRDAYDLKRSIAAWMIKNGFFHEKADPDLYYQGISVPEIISQPLQMTVRIQQEGSLSTLRISFSNMQGAYLDPASGSAAAEGAKQFIHKMLRFKID